MVLSTWRSGIPKRISYFSLPDLPAEVLGLIANYMTEADIRSLRLVSQHVCYALEYRALSTLTLDWSTSSCGRVHTFPVEKVQAYTRMGSTPGTNHVRHLTIRNICMDLKLCDSPFDKLLRLPDYYDHEYMAKREVMRKRLFQSLVENLFMGDVLQNNVRMLTWHLGCKTHSFGSRTDCTTTFHWICKLLSYREKPLECLTIVVESEASTERLQNLGKYRFPASKSVIFKALDTYKQPVCRLGLPPLTDPVHWIQNAANQRGLEVVVDIDLVYDRNLFAKLFPQNEGASRTKTTHHVTRYHRLNINLMPHTGFILEPHVFGHFRFLQTLSFSTTPRDGYLPPLPPNSFDSFWRQIRHEKIFVKNLTYPTPAISEAFIAYLASYPTPTLKVLRLEDHMFRLLHLRWTSESTREPFLSKALPAISLGLEELHIQMYKENHQWCHTASPTSLSPFLQCTSLRRLTISLDLLSMRDPKPQSHINHFIQTSFQNHPCLEHVLVIALVNRAWYDEGFIEHSVLLKPKDKAR
ncbi:hypothetical protein CVT24_003039 [Panaeolus cyanescens]|uniref:F-box domain-containing protein n=1 Tax=Panaeolus cyanescens TaxID=181874 RepID=A0A409VFR4_9AGAR|nr:hypothetical protein CVT24_003039 [Panaeolus cyanescens]